MNAKTMSRIVFLAVVTIASLTLFGAKKAAPGKPKGLSGKFVERDGKFFVDLKWRKVAKAKEYWIYTDIGGTLGYNTGLPEITGTSFSYPITDFGGDLRTFAVEARAKDNTPGERASIKIQIPALRIDSINTFKCIFQKDGNLLLSWEDEYLPGILGYRLFMNGKQIASEKEVAGKVRSWLVLDYAPPKGKDKVTFHVQAIGKYAESDKKVCWLNNYHRLPDRSIPSPNAMWVERTDDKTKRIATISWQEVDCDNFAGYELKVHNSLESKYDWHEIIPWHKDFKKMEFTYEIPEKWQKGELTFRVCAVNKDKKLGLWNEKTINLAFWRISQK